LAVEQACSAAVVSAAELADFAAAVLAVAPAGFRASAQALDELPVSVAEPACFPAVV
jgi:hypothetical protein